LTGFFRSEESAGVDLFLEWSVFPIFDGGTFSSRRFSREAARSL
jgi:hypothetical protein